MSKNKKNKTKQNKMNMNQNQRKPGQKMKKKKKEFQLMEKQIAKMYCAFPSTNPNMYVCVFLSMAKITRIMCIWDDMMINA